MKTLVRLFSLVLLSASIRSFARIDVVDGITWTFTVSDNKATLCATGSPAIPAIPLGSSGAIAIPSTLGGYPVTSIGSHAFQGCSKLTAITIPNSVTSIGWGAFNGCSGLTKITIPDSVTIIWAEAFQGCAGLTEVKLSKQLKNVDASAFKGCTNIRSVTCSDGQPCYGLLCLFPELLSKLSTTKFSCIPFWGGGVAIDRPAKPVSGTLFIPSKIGNDAVGAIGCYAFAKSTGLKSVYIPEGITVIGEGAFLGCTSLQSVVIPSSVTEIGAGAFKDCPLASVTFPDGRRYGVSTICFDSPFKDPAWDAMLAERKEAAAKALQKQTTASTISASDQKKKDAENLAALLTLFAIAGSIDQENQARQAREEERRNAYYRQQEEAGRVLVNAYTEQIRRSRAEAEAERLAREQRMQQEIQQQQSMKPPRLLTWCSKCDGTGRYGWQPCDACRGTGVVEGPF